MKQYAVYILTNWDHKVMYIGWSSNLAERIQQHKDKALSGFTAKYNVNKLVYYELTTDVHEAQSREIEIKKWRRAKKNRLVETMNSAWEDLSNEF